MRTRGTRGGILLSLEAADTSEAIDAVLASRSELLSGKVIVEISDRIPWAAIESLSQKVSEQGGELIELRPPSAAIKDRGETRIIAKTVRSGAQLESLGSIVVLGDVNAGAELIANDDIIIIGTLRGIAHAGASGNESAVIWAQQIRSPQLRICNALAQAGEESAKARGPEVAQLKDGAIVLRPWS